MSEQVHNVPSFASVAELRTTLESRDTRVTRDIYPRDGSSRLATVEDVFTSLTGTESGQLLLTSCGMSALAAVFEATIATDTHVAAAWQTYSQTGILLEDICRRSGARLTRFDSGEPTDVEKAISKSPNVVFAETVSNGPDTPVFDAEHAIATCREQGLYPAILLDNTLPLQTGYSTTSLPKYDNLVVVESATKAYAQNAELGGLIYSKDQDLIDSLRVERSKRGFGPSVGALAVLESTLPNSKAAFDERNTRVFRTTEILAQAAHRAVAGTSQLIVTHPSLPHHPNYAYSQERLVHGSSPVFYIQCLGDTDQFALTERLWDHPNIRNHVELGQSFGFDHTRILPNTAYPMVRISGGYDTDCDALAHGLADALSTV